jgi:hypothetical protein
MAYQPLELDQVRTRPVAQRQHKVRVEDFARPLRPGATVSDLIDSLPHILLGEDFRAVVAALSGAVAQRKPVIFGLGAHVIKCGLSPLIIDLMERGVVSAVALNGGGAIHDFEIAMNGATSEDVEANLGDGSYGMVDETGALMHRALEGAADGGGFGQAVGRALSLGRARHGRLSILRRGYELGVPVTVHVAIGTDTLHMLPDASGARIGELSHVDFRLLAAVVADLQGGGVYVNAGSAVILPEVFLKSVALARNLGYPVAGFTTVDLDMLRQYRPTTNVVQRHAALGARGYAITGHHELMLPLLTQAVLERLAGRAVVAAANGQNAEVA